MASVQDSKTTGMLKCLPSFNSNNFSKFQPDAQDKRNGKKLSLYVSTSDSTPQQVIKKDRSNILLRYLYQQLDKKTKAGESPQQVTKRKSADEVCEPPRRKVLRHISSSQSSSSSELHMTQE